MTNFENAFVEFIAKAQVKVNATYADSPSADPKIDYEPGRKYIRITITTYGQKSVFGFIDATKGDVLKAASWKAPAKNFARGNIFDKDNGVGRVGYASIQ